MAALSRRFRRRSRQRDRDIVPSDPAEQPSVGIEVPAAPAPVEIGPTDPLLAYLQSASGAVEVDTLELDSPALIELRAGGVKLVVPLVSQGELIGVLNLGAASVRAGLLRRRPQAARQPRRPGRARAAGGPAGPRAGGRGRDPAAHRAGARGRPADPAELPAQGSFPSSPGWQVAAHYQPAREVGGDFYDFLELPDGRLGSSSATSPTRACRPRW